MKLKETLPYSEFAFLEDQKMRDLLLNRYNELRNMDAALMTVSVIAMAGSVLEGIIEQVLIERKEIIKSTYIDKIGQKYKPANENACRCKDSSGELYGFAQLIKHATNCSKYFHSDGPYGEYPYEQIIKILQKTRNIIHPRAEFRFREKNLATSSNALLYCILINSLIDHFSYSQERGGYIRFLDHFSAKWVKTHLLGEPSITTYKLISEKRSEYIQMRNKYTGQLFYEKNGLVPGKIYRFECSYRLPTHKKAAGFQFKIHDGKEQNTIKSKEFSKRDNKWKIVSRNFRATDSGKAVLHFEQLKPLCRIDLRRIEGYELID